MLCVRAARCETMFVYKTFRSGKDTLLAISDASLLGKCLSNDKFDIKVSEDFYSGVRCGEKKALKAMSEATIINAIGKNIIKVLQKNGIVEKDNVLLISGVPHAQVVIV